MVQRIAAADYKAPWRSVIPTDDTVLMTRIDDDDGFATDALARIQATKVTGRTALMLPDGRLGLSPAVRRRASPGERDAHPRHATGRHRLRVRLQPRQGREDRARADPSTRRGVGSGCATSTRSAAVRHRIAGGRQLPASDQRDRSARPSRSTGALWSAHGGQQRRSSTNGSSTIHTMPSGSRSPSTHTSRCGWRPRVSCPVVPPSWNSAAGRDASGVCSSARSVRMSGWTSHRG